LPCCCWPPCRLSRGQSPLYADALHFHHLVMRAGFGVRGAFGLIAVLNALLAGIGIGLRRLDAPDWLSFTLLMVVGALLIRGIDNADLMARLLMRTALRRHTVRARTSSGPAAAGIGSAPVRYPGPLAIRNCTRSITAP
jgi:hypothetical protein